MRHYRYADIAEKYRIQSAYLAGLIKQGLFPPPIKTPGPRGCALFGADVVNLWASIYWLTSRGRQRSPTDAAEETMRRLDEIRQNDDPRQASRKLIDELNQEAAERDRWHLPLRLDA
jgi:hypothetical protein